MITKEITVLGTVQGVGFRFYTYQKANHLGIKGYVKNMPDGSVKIIAQAPDEKTFNSFLYYIKRGPSMARVQNVIVQDAAEQNFDSFAIH